MNQGAIRLPPSSRTSKRKKSELLNQIDIRVGTIESLSDVCNSEKLVATFHTPKARWSRLNWLTSPAHLRNWPGSWRRRAPTLSAPTRRCPRGRRRRSWCLRSPDPPSEDKTSNRVAHGTGRCSAALMNSSLKKPRTSMRFAFRCSFAGIAEIG
jgi:hypothetical protein